MSRPFSSTQGLGFSIYRGGQSRPHCLATIGIARSEDQFTVHQHDVACFLQALRRARSGWISGRTPPGQQRLADSAKIDDADVEKVLTLTLESKPKAAAYCSTRQMAKASGISQAAVSHIWRAFSLATHRADPATRGAIP